MGRTPSGLSISSSVRHAVAPSAVTVHNADTVAALPTYLAVQHYAQTRDAEAHAPQDAAGPLRRGRRHEQAGALVDLDPVVHHGRREALRRHRFDGRTILSF